MSVPRPVGESHQALRDRPQRERSGVQPPQVHAIGQHAHRDLQQRVRPEERRQQHALGFRAELQLLGDQRQRERDRRAIEVVDERRGEEQADDRPASGVGQPNGDF